MHIGYYSDLTHPDLINGIPDPANDFYSANWESVLDFEEIEIDPGVTVTRNNYLANRLFISGPTAIWYRNRELSGDQQKSSA